MLSYFCIWLVKSELDKQST